MKTFEEIYERAVKRKGADNIEELINVAIQSPAELAEIPADRYLSSMTKAIFKAGFVWKIIEHKWSGFEEAFWKFNVNRCAWISPDDLDSLYQDARIIKNSVKINTVSVNATMIMELDEEQGGFSNRVANWPTDDFAGLLALLNKRGSRLGILTSQYFLRSIGKDGYVFSRDVIAALVNAGVIEKQPTSRAAFQSIQNAFNEWSNESGLGLAQISRTLGLSIDG